MSELMVEAWGLRKAFGDREILRGVNLRLERGQVTGLLGLNAAGKSTLIRCLLGLLRATSGSAQVFGRDAWELGAGEKSRLGYVPQEVWLFPTLTVSGMVNYTAAFYEGWDRVFVGDLLRRWDLPVSKSCGLLSPGERQKLGIALALGHDPELLILDEPVASLDPLGRRVFLESLLELAGDGERSILFSTHITSDVERVASHVALMRGGVVEFHEDLDGVKDRVKRLRLSAGAEFPAELGLSGVLRWEPCGSSGVLTVSNFTESLPEELRLKWGADVVVEDLNLEEIFVAYHEGR